MDSSLPVIKVIPQRGEGDCAIACLAMYLDKSYEDVLAAAVGRSKNTRVHRTGMTPQQVLNIGKALGVDMKWQKKHIDLETACGVLYFEHGVTAHVVVVKAGLVIEPDGGTVWDDPALYLLTQGAKSKSLVLISARED
jgi:hypothetical protein